MFELTLKGLSDALAARKVSSVEATAEELGISIRTIYRKLEAIAGAEAAAAEVPAQE